jgi:hypothetical protein
MAKNITSIKGSIEKSNTDKIKSYQSSIIKSLTKFSTTCKFMEKKLAEEQEVINGEDN